MTQTGTTRSTGRSSVRTSAPGKLMVSGEYAVLHGAEAVVAAVDRRAYVQLRPAEAATAAMAGPAASAPAALPPEVLATRACVEARLGTTSGALSLDVAELQQAGKKLGLGSSAAAAAATAAALLAAHGRDLRDPAVRELCLELALEGHRAVAPDGSGADVAASVLGGFVRFRKLGDGVETHPLAWPAGLLPVVVWTGQPARTSNLVAKVAALATDNPNRHRYCMGALGAEADQLVSALLASDLPAVLESFDAYGGAMHALGEAAGVGIVDDTLLQIRALAQAAGGAAKPSGAGGGDVALALFTDPEAANVCRASCARAQIEVLSLLLGAPGERYEEP